MCLPYVSEMSPVRPPNLPHISEIRTNPSSFRLIIKPEAIYPTVPFTQNPFVIFTKFPHDFPVHASLVSCLHTTRVP